MSGRKRTRMYLHLQTLDLMSAHPMIVEPTLVVVVEAMSVEMSPQKLGRMGLRLPSLIVFEWLLHLMVVEEVQWLLE